MSNYYIVTMYNSEGGIIKQWKRAKKLVVHHGVSTFKVNDVVITVAAPHVVESMPVQNNG